MNDFLILTYHELLLKTLNSYQQNKNNLLDTKLFLYNYDIKYIHCSTQKLK